VFKEVDIVQPVGLARWRQRGERERENGDCVIMALATTIGELRFQTILFSLLALWALEGALFCRNPLKCINWKRDQH